MKSRDEVDAFTKLLIQMESVLTEIGELSKKKPNDGLNKFKLRLINTLLTQANTILAKESRPFADFELFSEDELPTNSDVVLILSQYLGCIKKFGRDNTVYYDYDRYWLIGGKRSDHKVEWHRLDDGGGEAE